MNTAIQNNEGYKLLLVHLTNDTDYCMIYH